MPDLLQAFGLRLDRDRYAVMVLEWKEEAIGLLPEPSMLHRLQELHDSRARRAGLRGRAVGA